MAQENKKNNLMHIVKVFRDLTIRENYGVDLT